MSAKYSKEWRLKNLFRRSAAPPTPSPPQPAAHWASIDPPSSNPLIANAQTTRSGIEAGAKAAQAATSLVEKSFKPPDEQGLKAPASATSTEVQTSRTSTDTRTNDTQEPATPSRPTKTPNRADEHEPKALNSAISQRLWNDAYDSLQKEDEIFVGSYLKTLETVLRFEASKDPSSDPGDIAAKLKYPSQRQIYMQKLVKEGQEKVAKASKITAAVGNFAEAILKVKPMVDLAIGGIPQAAPAALPWAGVCIGLQILSNPARATKSNLAGIAHVVSRMNWYCALSEHLLRGDDSSVLNQLEEKAVALYKALLRYQMESACSYYRHQGYVFLHSLANRDKWDGDLKAVTDAENALQTDSDQYSKLHADKSLDHLLESARIREQQLGDIHQDVQTLIDLQKNMWTDEKDKKCLRDLCVVDPQDDMKKIENKKDTLLDEAYKWIFDTDQYTEFTNWSNAESDLPSSRLMWVRGEAGTGKTMLLMGIIRELSSRPATLAPKVSYFFCQGTDETLKSATATLRSLIWLLLVQQPRLIAHLRPKHENNSSLFKDETAFFALSDAFKSMLKDPDLSSVYFIIDALDECEQGFKDLVDLISISLTLSNRVKWLVSSRPTVQTLGTPDTASINLDAENLEGPVNAYVEHKLSVLKTREGYDGSVLHGVREEVSRRAEKTFLWVALVFKELDAEDENHSPLHGSYAIDIIREIPSGLTKLYGHLMARLEKGFRKDPQYCKDILVAAVLAYRPLVLSELGVLAALPTNMEPQTIVRKCGSFLTTREGTVYLIHQSAKDYLDKNFESRLQQAGVARSHVDISMRCIETISSKLKRNMCEVDFGVQSKDITPPELEPLAPIRYSCAFWADHLCVPDSECSERQKELMDDGRVHTFLKEHFLHWLESLSLLGKLSDGMQSIRRLLDVVQQQPAASHQLLEFLKDAEKFILSCGSIIERAPLQTYGSALVFSPTTSNVKKSQWKERLVGIHTVAGIRDYWEAHRQTLEGHSGWVSAVAFSPDGKTLASASHDETVRLWDATTGAPRQTLKVHSGWVYAVAFSPDGKTLALASDDRSVQLWDATTGAPQQTLEGHSSLVSDVTFSPDGKTLASASGDRTVRLWDATTGAPQQILEGDTLWVYAVVFSPDSKTLASASHDKTVRLWDVTTGTPQQTLKGHSGYVSAVAFSPDGKTLASASGDETVRLWDVTTGAPWQTLEGHSGYVSAVAFSPDSKTLVSASEDKTVRLWDATTGAPQQTLKGHSGWVSAIAFSPNGKTLASASHDRTVRLWDATMGAPQPQQTLEGHSSYVSAVAFSPNGKTLASASYDKTVRLWDATTGTPRQTLKGHSGYVNAVAFSPNGKTLASASYDMTVRLWDATTGTPRQTLKVDCTLFILSFDVTDSYLSTDIGVFPLNKPSTLNLTPTPVLPRKRPSTNCRISLDGQWITWDSKKLIWLPEEYRPLSSAVAQGAPKLVLGCRSGRVLFFEFSDK